MATNNGDDPGRSAGAAVAEPDRANNRLVEFDQFIDAQLRKTRSHVRSVDIAANVMILLAGTLAYFLVAAAFDHWIVTGGLGIVGRSLFLAIYLAATAAFLFVRMLPLLVHSINPLYAAHTIERSRPSLKNTVVNFLLFRANRGGLSRVIYEAVEEQAAANLATARVDAAVDRSNLIKIGYVLLGVVVACALYAIVSPKDLFQTVGRVAAPWADIGAPTSTTITEIEPGDAQAFRGQQVALSARIRDLPDGSKVIAYYSTADGQIVDREIEMAPGDDGDKHVCLLPAGETTLQQDVDYRIEAGDAISRDFHIEVVAAPTIFVRAVEYKYPTYTGLLAQRVERQGDVKAIEGTQITLDALANGDIKAAHIDFNCDGTLDQRMTIDGMQAKASFRLALREDRKTPKHESYQLIFTNAQGQRNPQPIRHLIEVTRDIPPQIDFVAPEKDEIDLPANGSLELEVVANDPDFALRMVKLSAAKGKQPVFDKLLLDEPRPGQFVAKYRFEPARLELEPGDVVEYSALAEDNKDPNPNRTETPKRWIRIVSPDSRQQKQDRVAQNDPSDDGQGRPGDPGDGGDDQPRDNQRSDDGAGEAVDGGKNDSTEKPEQSENRKQQDSDEQEHGDREDASGQPREGQPGEGANSGDSKQDDGQRGDGQHGDSEQGEGQQGKGEQGEGANSGDRSAGQEQGDGAGQQDESAARNVPSDGSNDGDAIERILKHRQQQQGEGDQDAAKQRQEDRGDDERADDTQARDTQADSREAGDEQKDRSARQQDAGQRGDQPERDPQRGDRRQDGGTDRGAGQSQGPDQKQAADRQSEGPGDGQRPTADNKADQPAAQREQRPAAEAGEEQSPDEQAADKQGRETQPGDKQQDDQQQDDQQMPAERGQPGDKPGTGPDAQQDRPADGPDKTDSPAEGASKSKQTQGQGAQSKSNPTGDAQPPSGEGQRPDAKGGDGQHNQGPSGAGQKSQDKQGSPSADEQESRPRDKTMQPSGEDTEQPDPNKEQSPSTSQHESDSDSQEQGDRSGGGKRGGGQKANKEGTGGAGQNTAADQGAGASQQSGDGETSDRAGSDAAADKQTGKSGSQPGKGSDKSADDAGDKAGADGSGDGRSEDADNPPTDSTNSPGGGGVPTGGRPGGPDSPPPPERPYRTAPAVADKANLDYTRKATEMALSHLKDELAKEQPDSDLLKELGWNRDDLQKFVDRWERMRQDAQAPDERGDAAKRELDETLRSLGLRPRTTTLGANEARNDEHKGLRESRHSTPPPEYAEQLKAYTQGTARGGK